MMNYVEETLEHLRRFWDSTGDDIISRVRTDTPFATLDPPVIGKVLDSLLDRFQNEILHTSVPPPTFSSSSIPLLSEVPTSNDPNAAISATESSTSTMGSALQNATLDDLLGPSDPLDEFGTSSFTDAWDYFSSFGNSGL